MVRKKRAEAEQYRIDGIENRMRMKVCIENADKTGARHYLIEARKSDYYYEQDLKQSANMTDVKRKLNHAIVNLEMAKNMSASNVTLEQLQEAMPLEKIDEIMDTFRDQCSEVDESSRALARQDEASYLDQEEIETQLEELFLNVLPSVPVKRFFPPAAEKTILKTE